MISTIHRYDIIYQNYHLEWFQYFIKDLHKIAQLFNAPELIFVSGDIKALCEYEESLVEGKSYDEIKADLIKKHSMPITDYKKLNYKTLNYKKVKEWFLETFEGL